MRACCCLQALRWRRCCKLYLTETNEWHIAGHDVHELNIGVQGQFGHLHNCICHRIGTSLAEPSDCGTFFACATVSSSVSARRPQTAKLYPAPANANTVVRPMPELPQLTNAVFWLLKSLSYGLWFDIRTSIATKPSIKKPPPPGGKPFQRRPNSFSMSANFSST